MIHVNPGSRFIDIIWYAPDLLLSTAYSWKPYVNKLQSVRSTSLAFDTNSGVGATFPSLTTLKTNKVYLLDAKNIPAGGFDIDNGSPPNGQPDILVRKIPDTLPHSVTFVLDRFPTSIGTPVFKDLSKSTAGVVGTLTVRLDTGAELTPTAFNTLISSFVQADYESNTHRYTLTYSSNTPGTVEVPIL
jgi:hypothetical protein